MAVFDENLFLLGIEQRKATVGEEYVKKNLDEADDFSRPFQEANPTYLRIFLVPRLV